MFSREIADIIIEREQARIDATMRETSPAAVLARIEREQSLGRPGPLRNALVEALWGARDTAVALAIGLALLTGCDAPGLTVEQTTDAPQDVPQAIQPQPAPVPPPPAPVAPPMAIPAPLPAPVPPQAAPAQPPLAPEAPLPAPTPPPAVPPCFDRDLGDITACPGRTDCATSSTVTSRTMCQWSGITYVPSCETCAGV